MSSCFLFFSFIAWLWSEGDLSHGTAVGADIKKTPREPLFGQRIRNGVSVSQRACEEISPFLGLYFLFLCQLCPEGSQNHEVALKLHWWRHQNPHIYGEKNREKGTLWSKKCVWEGFCNCFHFFLPFCLRCVESRDNAESPLRETSLSGQRYWLSSPWELESLREISQTRE